jgi:hypothetical protein
MLLQKRISVWGAVSGWSAWVVCFRCTLVRQYHSLSVCQGRVHQHLSSTALQVTCTASATSQQQYSVVAKLATERNVKTCAKCCVIALCVTVLSQHLPHDPLSISTSV